MIIVMLILSLTIGIASAAFIPSPECHDSADCMRKLKDNYLADAEQHLRERFQLPPLEICNGSPDSSSVLMLTTQIVLR